MNPLTLVLQYRPFTETASGLFMTDPAPTKTIHFCPDELDLLILAVRAFKSTPEGRKHGGRLNWIDSKLCSCKGEICQIWPTA